MSQDQSILFIPVQDNKELHYKVTITNYADQSKREASCLKYDCFLKFKKQSWNGYIVNFQRTNLDFDHTNKHEPIFELFLVSGQILYDLDLEVSSYGEISHITNWKTVQAKWEELKFKIKSNYKGEIVDRVLSQMDIPLQKEETAIASLSKDPFFYNFLMGIYGYYKKGSTTYQGKLSGFIPQQDLSITKTNHLLDNRPNGYRVESSAKVSQTILESMAARLQIDQTKDPLTFDLTSVYDLSEKKVIKSIAVKNVLLHNNHILNKSKVYIQQQVIA